MTTNQRNFRVRNGLTIDGATSGSSSFANPATGTDVSYTLPTGLPAVSGYALVSDTSGNMSWSAASGATYTIDASTTTGGANLNLVGSDATTDTVAYLGSGATTVTRTDANTITVSSTDTNTTYTQNASATTGGANLNLVGSDATTDTVTFQSGTNITVAQVDANTINISSSGITPTDVQQVFAEVRNQEGSTITIGQVVYLFGATGNNPTVKLADNGGDATSAKSLGLVYDASINNGAQGLVITQGLITGVNTASFAEGDSLYLGSTPGSVTNVKPYAPEHLVYIGVVVKSNVSAGEIFVRVQNGYELDELHDVDLITNPPTNNQVLTYVAATDLWTAQNTQNIFNQSLNTTNNVEFNKVEVDTTLQWSGSTSGSITMAAPAIAGTQAYILPTAYPTTSGWALVSDTAGNMSWAAGANPFDQNLNTTDSVQFSGLSVVNGAGAFSTGVGVSVTLSSDNITVGDGTSATNGFTINGGTTSAYTYIDNASNSYNIGVNGITDLWKFNNDLTTSFPNFTFPAADGTNGQVLETNGTGTLSWVTPSAGGGGLPMPPSSSNATNNYSLCPGNLSIASLGSQQTIAAQSVIYTPFYVSAPITLSEVAISVSTAATLASCNAMIYISEVDISSATGWQPTANLSGGYLGEITNITTTGLKTITGLSTVLPAGAYLMVVQFSNFTGTLQIRGPASQCIIGSGYAFNNADQTAYNWRRTGVTYTSGTPAAVANWSQWGGAPAGISNFVLCKWSVN